jgi:signal peptidase
LITLLRRLANIVAGLVLGFALVMLLATQVLGYRVASIATDSMRPTLAPGDLIITQPVAITSVVNGDIVLFQTGIATPILVAHRVNNVVTVNVNVTDSKTGIVRTETSKVLRTKGDANAQVDEQPVDATVFRGRLWLSVPGAGRFLASPLPYALIATGLGALWLLFELARWARRDRPTEPPAVAT